MIQQKDRQQEREGGSSGKSSSGNRRLRKHTYGGRQTAERYLYYYTNKVNKYCMIEILPMKATNYIH